MEGTSETFAKEALICTARIDEATVSNINLSTSGVTVPSSVLTWQVDGTDTGKSLINDPNYQTIFITLTMNYAMKSQYSIVDEVMRRRLRGLGIGCIMQIYPILLRRK